MDSNISPADLAAVVKDNDNFGNGGWWIIVLFIFMFGWGGGG